PSQLTAAASVEASSSMALSLTASQTIFPDQAARGIVVTGTPIFLLNFRALGDRDRATSSVMVYPAPGSNSASACARFPVPASVTVFPCFWRAIFAQDNRADFLMLQ
ncbi:MAG TPA: hypothetical protein VFU86_00850, partial [Terriglobales bacterium]|nr:hypothetical protein [Terriglobales bacterium]